MLSEQTDKDKNEIRKVRLEKTDSQPGGKLYKASEAAKSAQPLFGSDPKEIETSDTSKSLCIIEGSAMFHEQSVLRLQSSYGQCENK